MEKITDMVAQAHIMGNAIIPHILKATSHSEARIRQGAITVLGKLQYKSNTLFDRSYARY